MDTKYLLFVDDLKPQQMLCKDAVAEWNDANEAAGRRIALHGALTLEEGVELLKHVRFDAAFVDLKMPDGKRKSDPSVGNELARNILFKTGIPVGIISGNLADFDNAWIGFTAVETFFKGEKDAFQKALAWLAGLWPMMDILSASRSSIREVSAEVFGRRLWPNWSMYMQATEEGHQSLVPMVARQYVWHLSEMIGEPEAGQPSWHPLENWICPPKSEFQISTGDLYELDGELWVVLSPPCDLVNGNVTDALLAYCDRSPIKDWDASVKKLQAAEGEARTKAAKFFNPYLNQNTLSQHFLAPLPDDMTKPMLVRFNRLTTRPLAELRERLKDRRATVSAPFVANLTQRFGAYASRMGQPNIDPSYFHAGKEDPGKDAQEAA